jgi:hypothetical protein
MPIRVTCPSCHRTYRVGDHQAGRRGLCPDCGAVVAVPREELDWLEPEDDDRPGGRRRERPRRITPADHLPAWRRVSTGFLIQQFAAALLLLGIALVVVGTAVLADDPGNFQNEPNTAQTVAAAIGLGALFVGFAGQAIGRLVSARTPARSPRTFGVLAAAASGMQLAGGCLVVLLIAINEAGAQQGNPPDPALEALGGLALFGWMVLSVVGEVLHGVTAAAVARVLRADGARLLGNGLAAYAAVAGLLCLFAFCGLAAWVGNNPPQNPDPDQEQSNAVLVWMVAAGLLTALYLMLDVVLLQQGRSAVARVAADADRPDPHDGWDD